MRPQEAPGASRRPQEALRRPQESPGLPMRPKEAPGGLKLALLRSHTSVPKIGVSLVIVFLGPSGAARADQHGHASWAWPSGLFWC